MSTPEIKSAEAELKAAQDRVYGAEAVLADEKSKVKQAHEKLKAARLSHDKTLPKAVIKIANRYGRAIDEVKVCVVRCTEKTAFVRVPGEEGHDQYRLNKSGTWTPYPAPSFNYGDWRELILAKAGSAS